MKLLFTDLDGTLLNNNSLVSPGTRAFLDEFLADPLFRPPHGQRSGSKRQCRADLARHSVKLL